MKDITNLNGIKDYPLESATMILFWPMQTEYSHAGYAWAIHPDWTH